MSRHVFRAIWPVTDPTRPLRDLIAEASAELPRLLLFARAEPTAAPRWCIRPGKDVPGSGGHDEVLLADMPVEVIPRDEVPVQVTRRAEFVRTVEQLLDAGETEAVILARLDLTRDAYRSRLIRAGRRDLADRGRPSQRWYAS